MSEPRRARRVHVDTDPGLDDLLALAFAAASPELDIVGLTTVAGNAPLEAVTYNALGWCALAGLDVPVGRGADAPLELPRIDATHFHGADGRRGIPLPAPLHAAEADAGAVLRESLTARGAELLIALGPLTNVARLAASDPGLLDGLPVLWMGGSLCGGNVTPAAEFNCHVDPHAVDAVLDSGAALRVIGLDVTGCVRLREAELSAQRWPGTARGAFACALLDALVAAEEIVSGQRAAVLHDPTAIAAALDVDVLRWERRWLAVEAGDGPERGRMLELPGGDGDAPLFACEVHHERVRRLFLERLVDWCAEDAA